MGVSRIELGWSGRGAGNKGRKGNQGKAREERALSIQPALILYGLKGAQGKVKKDLATSVTFA